MVVATSSLVAFLIPTLQSNSAAFNDQRTKDSQKESCTSGCNAADCDADSDSTPPRGDNLFEPFEDDHRFLHPGVPIIPLGTPSLLATV